MILVERREARTGALAEVFCLPSELNFVRLLSEHTFTLGHDARRQRPSRRRRGNSRIRLLLCQLTDPCAYAAAGWRRTPSHRALRISFRSAGAYLKQRQVNPIRGTRRDSGTIFARPSAQAPLPVGRRDRHPTAPSRFAPWAVHEHAKT